jgi:CSLREA domain-containing protein
MRERKLFVEPLEDRRMLAVITVDTLADGTGVPGTTLREAISAANPNDTINFSVTGIINLFSQLNIDKSLTILGPGTDHLTVKTSGFNNRIFFVSDGNDNSLSDVELSGMTITGGNIFGDGGGIWSRERLTLIACDVSGNTARGLSSQGAEGGGIYSSGLPGLPQPVLTIKECTIAENSAMASHQVPGGPAGVGGNGGGIYSDIGDVNIQNSTISGNSAAVAFNGYYNYSGGFGGGICAFSNLVVTNTTIANNYAGHFGGGIASDTSAISNTIIANNTSGVFSNGMDLFVSDTLEMEFSLIGGDSYHDLDEAPLGSPDENGNLIGGPIHGEIDPLLGNLQNNGGPTRTHALLAGSPARNAGNPSFVPLPEFDQRGTGFSRVVGSRIDMGAYEDQSAVAVDSADFDEDGDVDGRDFLSWQRGYGIVAPNAEKTDGDADSDTDVDGNDLSIWQDQYGQTDIIATLLYKHSSNPFSIIGLAISTQTSTILFEDDESAYVTIQEVGTLHETVDTAFADFAPKVGLVADFGDFVAERKLSHSQPEEDLFEAVL